MRIITLSRFALAINAAALLVACGGSQPPAGVPGALPWSRAPELDDVRHKRVFEYTGTEQAFTVPLGVKHIMVAVKGASGGGNCGGCQPGKGGLVRATVSVTPGETLYIFVGGAGGDRTGGFNGGGVGGKGQVGGGGGGGASDIREGGDGLINRVVVAAGGGGSGEPGISGYGGGGEGGGRTGEGGLYGHRGYDGTGGAGGDQHRGGAGGERITLGCTSDFLTTIRSGARLAHGGPDGCPMIAGQPTVVPPGGAVFEPIRTPLPQKGFSKDFIADKHVPLTCTSP